MKQMSGVGIKKVKGKRRKAKEIKPLLYCVQVQMPHLN
jgi:hypothetical protein